MFDSLEDNDNIVNKEYKEDQFVMKMHDNLNMFVKFAFTSNAF